MIYFHYFNLDKFYAILQIKTINKTKVQWRKKKQKKKKKQISINREIMFSPTTTTQLY